MYEQILYSKISGKVVERLAFPYDMYTAFIIFTDHTFLAITINENTSETELMLLDHPFKDMHILHELGLCDDVEYVVWKIENKAKIEEEQRIRDRRTYERLKKVFEDELA
jgi:hypothetical protein